MILILFFLKTVLEFFFYGVRPRAPRPAPPKKNKEMPGVRKKKYSNFQFTKGGGTNLICGTNLFV